MATSRLRIWRKAERSSEETSRPLISARPPEMRPLGGSTRCTASATVDFPEPDSPTSP